MTTATLERPKAPARTRRGQKPPVVEIQDQDQTPVEEAPEQPAEAPETTEPTVEPATEPESPSEQTDGEELRRFRERLGLSRAALATIAKTTGSCVWRVEANKAKGNERENIVTALKAVEADPELIPPQFRKKVAATKPDTGPTKAALLDRNTVAAKLLQDIAGAKSLAQAKELAARAFAALMGEQVSTQPQAGDAE